MIRLYQSYLKEEQINLSSITIPLIIENNTENSAREYELFKKIAEKLCRGD